MARDATDMRLRSGDRRRASRPTLPLAHLVTMPHDLEPRATGRAEAAAFDDDAVPLGTLDEPTRFADGGSGPGREAPAHETTEEADDDDDVVVLSWYQRPINVAALVIAFALIGGMVGWLISDARSDTRGNAVDIGFLQDMRTHHEQAVEMAFTYLGLPATNPGLRTVASSIVVGQEIDVGRMIQMLRDMHAPEAAETDEAMAWMGHAMPAAQMPGMATEAQLEELAASSGRSADELFVTLMTAHHEGGIEMAEYAVEHAGLEKVRSMARSMINGQRGDIAEMQSLLA
jgi:uncharacterized protein (DUF305 family)